MSNVNVLLIDISLRHALAQKDFHPKSVREASKTQVRASGLFGLWEGPVTWKGIVEACKDPALLKRGAALNTSVCGVAAPGKFRRVVSFEHLTEDPMSLSSLFQPCAERSHAVTFPGRFS